jgi:hypothetical protein
MSTITLRLTGESAWRHAGNGLRDTGVQLRATAKWRCYWLIVSYFLSLVAQAANPIQLENAKAGTTSWQLSNPAVNHEIEGYASRTSLNRGEQISFFVNTAAASYTLEVFRVGWYGGAGGRSVHGPITRSGRVQPKGGRRGNGEFPLPPEEGAYVSDGLKLGSVSLQKNQGSSPRRVGDF